MPSKQPIQKQSWKPGNMLSPVPAVLVSCGGTESWKPNLITIAWAGTVCTNPPMVSISIKPERHSYDIIRSTGEFVVNLPTVKQVKATDWCGVVSGRDHDKFEKTGLTPAPSLQVRCPIVAECPVNMECRVVQMLELGSHTMFVAEVVAVQVSSHLIDEKNKLCLEFAGLIAYVHGAYVGLGEYLGHFGFSVRKPTTPKTASKRKTTKRG
ncbi:MAG: flavin reductase family protein [Kiritimatiellaceae bacterium]|nr:flavin reductase family protein [Kiritimatiellaceae bacterium]